MSDPRPVNPHGEQIIKSSWNESAWARYALAIAAVAAATLATFALREGLGEPASRITFVFYYVAILVAVRFGKLGPGLLSILLSTLAGNFFFLRPNDVFSLNPTALLQAALFVFISLLIVLLTDRSQRAEAEAHASRESLETTLKSIGDAVISTDTGGSIEFMNGVAERLTGWPLNDARGRTLAEVFRIVNEQTREAVESPITKVLREGETVSLANQNLLIARDGTETPIDDSGAPIKDERGRTTGVVLVFHDISERRKSEATLRQRERELTDFIENATVGLHWVGADGTILWANRAELEMLGYEAEEYIGHNVSEFHADREVINDILTRLTSKDELHNYEARLLHKDGSIRYGLISSNVLWDERGKFVHTRCFTRDVTDRKRADEETARLAAIVEFSDDAIIGKTLEGIIVSWNDAAERMYGYAAEEAIGQHISLLAPHERIEELSGIMSKLRNGERVVHLETKRVRKDGTQLDVSLTISPIRDAAGRPVGASTIARDITEKKRVQEELRESEQRFRNMADNAPVLIWVNDLEGCEFVNREYMKFLGVSEVDVRGFDWAQFIHPDDRDAYMSTYNEALSRGATFETQFRFRQRDGEYRWMQSVGTPRFSVAGKLLGYIGSTLDITDIKQAGERMAFLAEAGETLSASLEYEATLERFASLAVESLADYCLIDIVGDDGIVRRVATAHADPALDALTGELRRFPPDLSKPEGIPKVLRTGKTEVVPRLTDEQLTSLTQGEEHRRLLERLDLKSFMTVPLVARGRVTGALTLAATGTERAYAPLDVALAEELARRAALAIENARLYSRAQEVNRAKDEFLATLSHELRTPLTPIIGWTNMIRSGRLGAQDTGQGLDVIEKNAHSLSRLINDLLDMSSILSGKMRIERAPVALDAVVREAIETVRPRADARRVALEITSANGGERVSVNGDRTRLVQVFWNLLDNAVKFSPDGGRVRVRVEGENGAARVHVEDEGAGVAREFLPHVFERFRQADMGTTRRHGGLGIGLALVKSFVEAHGGRVEVESEGDDRGTRFTVSLPAVTVPREQDAEDAGAGATIEPCPEETCRVLLIEDAPDTLEMLRVVFDSRGYSATTCASAEEALSVAEGQRFDIIVSDIGLPRIDGYELIERLRRLPHMRGVPALALTGYASTKDAQAALDAGFDAHVAKPVNPSALAEQMERLMKQKPQDG
jgi:PAS domain S-box-containing protein